MECRAAGMFASAVLGLNFLLKNWLALVLNLLVILALCCTKHCNDLVIDHQQQTVCFACLTLTNCFSE